MSFFFQAEDGIRVTSVTGVQTCALPIFCAPMFSRGSRSSISLATVTPSLVMTGAPNFFSITALRPLGPRRSEERRVGQGVVFGGDARLINEGVHATERRRLDVVRSK